MLCFKKNMISPKQSPFYQKSGRGLNYRFAAPCGTGNRENQLHQSKDEISKNNVLLVHFYLMSLILRKKMPNLATFDLKWHRK